MAGADREPTPDGIRRGDGTDWPGAHADADDSSGDQSADPRLYPEAIRVVETADDERSQVVDAPDDESDWVADGDEHAARVVLVGVVHDHPASVYRAGHVVDRVAPDAVAVELPGLALDVFERLPPAGGPPVEATDADGESGATARPNEMSAALADEGTVVAVVGFQHLDPVAESLETVLSVDIA
jgi:hypothetical protein